jgi:hypothetical protein
MHERHTTVSAWSQSFQPHHRQELLSNTVRKQLEMRLLNATTLELTTFIGDVPKYVILSHRRGVDQLVFEDITKTPISNQGNPARAKHGFAKVQGTCALAAKHGFYWV